jgi:hypothetical protein
MVDGRLERRGDGDPERETNDRSAECGDRTDDGAVRRQHEAEMLLRATDRREHAELTKSSLRDDRESCGGDERSQEQEDGGHGEHRQRVRRSVVADPHDSREARTALVQGVAEGFERRVVRVDENGDVFRRARERGRDQTASAQVALGRRPRARLRHGGQRLDQIALEVWRDRGSDGVGGH